MSDFVAPGPVLNLNAASNEDGHLTVSYSRPENGTGPFRYVIAVQDPDSGKSRIKRTHRKTSVTFKNLVPGVAYDIKVQARNRNNYNPTIIGDDGVERPVLSNKRWSRGPWVNHDRITIMGTERGGEAPVELVLRQVPPGGPMPPFAVGELFYVKRDPTGKTDWVKWDDPVGDRIRQYVEDRMDHFEDAHERVVDDFEEAEDNLAEANASHDANQIAFWTYMIDQMRPGVAQSAQHVIDRRTELEARARDIYEDAFPPLTLATGGWVYVSANVEDLT